jgi:hypothetical protein
LPGIINQHVNVVPIRFIQFNGIQTRERELAGIVWHGTIGVERARTTRTDGHHLDDVEVLGRSIVQVADGI